MSSQQTKVQPLSHSTEDYIFAAVSTITKINKIKKQIDDLRSETSNRQTEAERMRKVKIKIEENKCFFEQLCADTAINPTLFHAIERSEEQIKMETQSIKEQTISLPIFNLPEMSWVTDCLDQITEQSFKQLSDQLKKEAESIETLEKMQAKYCQKLKKVQEKLAKGYSQARSKKRYL